jgi:knotted carbamoyltransferase YgeW
LKQGETFVLSIDETRKVISEYASNMVNQDFLLTWDKTREELEATLYTAEALKTLYEAGVSTRVFQSGLGISLFRDQSTRTRFSFASACNLLGLAVQDMDESKSQIAHGETVRETACMISFLTEVIGIRDDMYIGMGNAYMREVAAALDDGFQNSVLRQRPAVINLQCDVDHPTQTMADLLYLKTHFGSLDKLRGKKIAMTWAYSPSYGKPLSVPQGIIGLMTRFGMDVTLAYPDGYDLLPECLEVAKENAAETGGSFHVSHSMEEAFKNADVVYPKSWAPFGVMEERTRLLKEDNHSGLADLEKRCLAKNAEQKSWECTEEKMKLTRDASALYMHCLPADISGVSCEQGEVAASVFERHRISTYREAGYKPFVIASMILLSRIPNAAEALHKLAEQKTPRQG